MSESTPLIKRIQEEYADFSATYRQIADIILDKPTEVARMSIGRLAQLTNVSDPSIMRFCYSLGFRGFKDFKFALAEELAIKTSYLHLGMDANTNSGSYIHKVVASSISSLTEMAALLNEATVNEAVEAMSTANHIEFWGQGASNNVAMDAYHKFFRVGIPCATTADPHMQAMSAGMMGPGDVLVVISHTGCTRELIRGARIARANGATVIGITMEHSHLAEQCTLVVGVNMNEDTDVVLPMVSRLAHLLVIDILTVGVLQALGATAMERVRRTKESLSAIKYTPLEEDESRFSPEYRDGEWDKHESREEK